MILLYEPIILKNKDLREENSIKNKLKLLYRRINKKEILLKETLHKIQLLNDQEYFRVIFDCDFEGDYQDEIQILTNQCKVYQKDIEYHLELAEVLERDLKKDSLKIKQERYIKSIEKEKRSNRIDERSYRLNSYNKSVGHRLYGIFYGYYWRRGVNSKDLPYKRLDRIQNSNRRRLSRKAFKRQYKSLMNYNKILPILNDENKVSYNIKCAKNNELDYIYGKRFFHGQRGDYKKILDYKVYSY